VSLKIDTWKVRGYDAEETVLMHFEAGGRGQDSRNIESHSKQKRARK
jgi:hypothetical protein